MSETAPSPLASLRDILVGSTVESGYEKASAAIGYGLGLARAAGAHLTVQSASWRLSGDDGWLADFDSKETTIVDRRLDALARALAQDAAGAAGLAGIVCTTETPSLSYPEIVNRLAERARLYDLTILDAGQSSYDLDRETIETALLRSGRPVIAVPPQHATFSARRIVLAWDGSAQAVRAANDALPLLRAAEAVEIVAVLGEAQTEGAMPGTAFAPHLARHGVTVSVDTLPLVDSVADTLRAGAVRLGAELIVMGAYRHSRVREFFFGGVTRSLLESSPAPLFLSH